MNSTATPRAILFADVCNSTRLYEEHGNTAALQMITDCLNIVRSSVEEWQGAVIKTIGDELMCSFTDPTRAVQAACRMQEGITDGSSTLELRIGVHVGEVIQGDNDVFGDTVNVAARMTNMARGGQIIISESTANALSSDIRDETRHVDTVAVKGKTAPMRIYEMVWQPDEATRMFSGLFSLPTGTTQIKVQFLNDTRYLTRNSPPLVVGRGSDSDVVLKDAGVSRHHATISIRRDKFILTDTSTNGTYVRAHNHVQYLRREDLELADEGEISFGHAFEKPTCNPVRFTCSTKIDHEPET